MALSRRGGRREPLSIWPGFVDAFTTLLLLLMFVLTIFLIAQFVLRDTITTQDTELDSLADQVASLADALGLERQDSARLEGEVAGLGADLAAAKAAGDQQLALIATLNTRILGQQDALAQSAARITSFEAQVASLLAERDAARGEGAQLRASVADLEAAKAQLVTDREALGLALAKARTEIDAQTEAARLSAARREAIDALLADLRNRVAARETSLTDALARLEAVSGDKTALAAQVTALQADVSKAEAARLAELAAAAALRDRLAGVEASLTDAEAARLADIAAAEALREKLRNSQDELTAMTLALEDQRKRAEDTLTLLAAAEAARKTLDLSAGAAMSEAERQAALLATANDKLSQEQARSAEADRRLALLNQQVVALRSQLGALQEVLDATKGRDSAAQVQIEALGSQLNSALATVAAEQRRRAELEEAERIRLQAETKNLERYRSEFFGQLRELLAGREGVRVVGDRFVFSSEVLFQPGSADLAPEGQAQIASVVRTLQEVAIQIPPEIDWMIRVDGHTDNVPLSGTGEFANNWELSQARALSVVLYMVNTLGFPPNHVAATGFGEFRPVAEGDSPEARAQNRRIELKLTER